MFAALELALHYKGNLAALGSLEGGHREAAVCGATRGKETGVVSLRCD